MLPHVYIVCGSIQVLQWINEDVIDPVPAWSLLPVLARVNDINQSINQIFYFCVTCIHNQPE